MFGLEFSNKITIRKDKTSEVLELDQRRIKIRENQNGLMALSYLAPVFDVMDLENFFDDVISSEKLLVDIGGIGEFNMFMQEFSGFFKPEMNCTLMGIRIFCY